MASALRWAGKRRRTLGAADRAAKADVADVAVTSVTAAVSAVAAGPVSQGRPVEHGRRIAPGHLVWGKVVKALFTIGGQCPPWQTRRTC